MLRVTLKESPLPCRPVLWAAAVGSFLPPFLGSALNVALPAIGRELHSSAWELALVVNAFLIAAAGALLPLGRWADASGRARVFSLGLFWQMVGCTAAIFAHSVVALSLIRAGQGVAAAATFATATALVAQNAPAGKRGRFLGANTAAVYLGLTVGPPLGGLLTQHLGWRSVFVASAALAAVGWVWVRPWARPEVVEHGHTPAGRLWLFAAGVACLLGGLAMARAHPGFFVLAAVGAAGVAASLGSPQNRPLDRALFSNPAFVFSNLAALVHYAATFSVALFLGLYLQLVGGLSPQTTGLLLLVQPLLMAALSPVAGFFSDRWEPRWVASAGMALTAAGLGTLSLLRSDLSLKRVVAGLVLLGVGFALFSAPNTHAVMGQAPPPLLSAASATLALARLAGQAGSLVLASFFLPKGTLAAEGAGSLVFGMRGHLLVAAFLCVVGIGFSLARGQVHGGGQS